jgi:hypothetical protein
LLDDESQRLKLKIGLLQIGESQALSKLDTTRVFQALVIWSALFGLGGAVLQLGGAVELCLGLSKKVLIFI